MSKMGEEQCWAFRSSPNPNNFLMKGAGDFLSRLGLVGFFRVPFLEHFFFSFGLTFGGHFHDFLKLFSLLGVTWSKQRF